MIRTETLRPFLIDVLAWDWGRMDKFAGAGIPSGSLRKWEFLGAMRELLPFPGEDIHSVVPLVWHKGDSVAPHVHPEHTLIYYVRLGSPPVPVIVEREPVLPKPGELIILPPGTKHAVPTSHSVTTRLAIAMRVNKQ